MARLTEAEREAIRRAQRAALQQVLEQAVMHANEGTNHRSIWHKLSFTS